MTDDRDTLHHRYRGEALDRYRIALYAQWLANRDGLSLPNVTPDLSNIGIEWNDDDKPVAVTFYGASYDLRVRLP